MFYLRNKKHKKIINAVWTTIGILVSISMILLYLPAFL